MAARATLWSSEVGACLTENLNLAKKKPLSEQELKGFIAEPRLYKARIWPFIKVVDRNNMREQDFLDCNPPHSGILLGIAGTF